MKSEETAALMQIPAENLLKFVHHVIDNVCGGIAVSHDSYQQCPLEMFWFAVQIVKKLSHSVTLEKTSREEALMLLQPLDKNAAGEVYEAIWSRKEEIKKSLLRESLSDVLHLKDFDWNVKLAVASDKILDLNEALVTLHLHTSTSAFESNSKSISIEMSAAQVDRLLEQLKETQQKLKQLQSS